ncbi:helical backbone metal receptor [Brooklawnia cerclae]|uniref:ABC-type Fe3+-hydroxamate transport system substrate-binding protein n=1 Tax=Brooklawnia cerclae TaxID=349934 RepID=A0ABX0SFJ8_9ACTN|nr:helical backbone metal receptor [Brooklawnia cerclae]NIH56770.1 ABC-type Fe3+-hydroxamate transport system substrate-binding protein [Brooklawnia cerclae]
MSVDDLGYEVLPGSPIRRVVSLVPSLTEALAETAPQLIVGCTDWCTRPSDLDARAGHSVARVRGTKNPDLAAIASLDPDLVIANQEENRRFDVDRLRAMGLAVWVTRIDSVDDALRSLERLIAVVLSRPLPGWLVRARTNWSLPDPPVTRRAVVCIWRDPWMVAGPATYIADVLGRSGVGLAPLPVDGWERARYPRVDLDLLRSSEADVVLLMDAPYPFSQADGSEYFAGVDVRIVPERPLAWYGPGLTDARSEIAALMA